MSGDTYSFEAGPNGSRNTFPPKENPGQHAGTGVPTGAGRHFPGNRGFAGHLIDTLEVSPEGLSWIR